MKGSMTVEAAYLFPFCFTILGIIGMLGIYTYNQAILQMSGYECMIKTMEERTIEEELFQRNLLERAENLGKARTFGVDALKASAKITSKQILLYYSGYQPMLRLPLEVTVIYQKVHPERALQIMEGLDVVK